MKTQSHIQYHMQKPNQTREINMTTNPNLIQKQMWYRFWQLWSTQKGVIMKFQTMKRWVFCFVHTHDQMSFLLSFIFFTNNQISTFFFTHTHDQISVFKLQSESPEVILVKSCWESLNKLLYFWSQSNENYYPEANLMKKPFLFGVWL